MCFWIHFEGFKVPLNKLLDKVNFLSTWIFMVSLVSCLPSVLTLNTFYYFSPRDSFSLILLPISYPIPSVFGASFPRPDPT